MNNKANGVTQMKSLFERMSRAELLAFLKEHSEVVSNDFSEADLQTMDDDELREYAEQLASY